MSNINLKNITPAMCILWNFIKFIFSKRKLSFQWHCEKMDLALLISMKYFHTISLIAFRNHIRCFSFVAIQIVLGSFLCPILHYELCILSIFLTQFFHFQLELYMFSGGLVTWPTTTNLWIEFSFLLANIHHKKLI